MKKMRSLVLGGVLLVIGSLALWGVADRLFFQSGLHEVGDIDGRSLSEREFQAHLAVQGLQQVSESQRQVLLDRYLEDAAMAAAIEKEGLESLERIEAEVAQYRRQRLIRTHFDQLLAHALSNEAVERYVSAHPEAFRQQEVRVAHLLVRAAPSLSEAERSKRQAQAQMLLEQVRHEGFAQVAEVHSQDRASAPRGGELGWIGSSHLGKAFFEAALALDVGAVAGPIESAHGYHLVTLLEPPREIALTAETTLLKARAQLRNAVLADERERLLALSRFNKRAPADRPEPPTAESQELDHPVVAIQPAPLHVQGVGR